MMKSYDELKKELIAFKSNDETNMNNEAKEVDSTSLEIINTLIEMLELSYEYETYINENKVEFIKTELLKKFFNTNDADLIKDRLNELRTLYNDIIENNQPLIEAE